MPAMQLEAAGERTGSVRTVNFRFVSLYGGCEVRWIPLSWPAGLVGKDGPGIPPELVFLCDRYWVYARAGYYLEVQPMSA